MHANPTTTQPQRGTASHTTPSSTSPTPSPDFISTWRAEHEQAIHRLRNLARRHGSSTESQRRRLVDSVVRHINEGHFGLDDANDFLHLLDIEPVCGPDQVTFRVPAALAMVHEDVETDIGTLEVLLETTEPGYMRWTRFAGCPDGYTITRPSRPDPYTQRRHTIVQADLRLTVTVGAYSPPDQLVGVAVRLLERDLARLQEYGLEILADPTVWQDNIPHSDGPDHVTASDAAEPAEHPDQFDPTRSWRWRDPVAGDEPDPPPARHWWAA